MPKPAKQSEKKCILIVEDSVDFSNLLKFIVEDEGFDGIQFPVNDPDIIKWAKEHKPAVILVDLALRRKAGMEYIEDLKADPETKTTPIIIITGRDLALKEIVDLQMRGIKYLRKGRVELDEIKNEIRLSAGLKARIPAASHKK
ncbi:MAG: OmpR [Bacteroidetes bacterium]|jgi:DNA-binding response OmpR family regulator|nr:OmpR [Bacteroidota bacterium]